MAEIAKQQAVTAEEEEKKAAAERNRIVTRINLAIFGSIIQHVITAQSEPMLVRQLCNGDGPRSVMYLANTQGLVGLIGLFLNQAGGKWSDAVGRKHFLLVGPIGNMILGQLVFQNPTNLPLVLVCRTLKLTITTFSNTVVTMAMFADILKGKELAAALTRVGAVVGAGVIVAPLMETYIIQKTGQLRSAYMALTLIGILQSLWCIFGVPETLDPRNKRTCSLGAALNPFGFVKIWTQGSKGLQKLVTITTVQMTLEGKNQHDVFETVKREELKLDPNKSRDLIVFAGVIFLVAGSRATPWLIQRMSARGFTHFTNQTNIWGLAAQGAGAILYSGKYFYWIFIAAVLVRCAGTNGACANALKACASDLAIHEGFGRGEFSAWVNNLRGFAGALGPIAFGAYYSWARSRNLHGGTFFWAAGIIGAVIPELLLMNVSDKEMFPPKEEKPQKALGGGVSGAPKETTT